jgi:hypothetical protein
MQETEGEGRANSMVIANRAKARAKADAKL